jgi:hypothetical protein
MPHAFSGGNTAQLMLCLICVEPAARCRALPQNLHTDLHSSDGISCPAQRMERWLFGDREEANIA